MLPHGVSTVKTSRSHDDALAIVDRFPVPMCQFARAYRCRGFCGQAAYGHDDVARQTFYGFRCHIRLCWPGALNRFDLAPGNASELAILPELVNGTWGTRIVDRNDWSPKTKAELAGQGLDLIRRIVWRAKIPGHKESLAEPHSVWH